ncbi:MAG: arginine--tRNA ligase [Coriobacteriaceae bacterium]|nr:arginine--tRNA ligase [Coriobacteriaceae bacterium]MDD7112575.1 arginine--tRNA ligase [Coriobacteriaceae bacterium]
MRARIAGLVSCAIAQAQAAGELPEFEVSDFGIERTNDAQKGDWTSTVAMRSSKAAHRAPRDIAAAIIAHMPADEAVVSVEAAGPGFLNFSLAPEAICGVFGQVIREGADFGRCNDGQGKKVDVEFVSANPVGPMHVGHGRWAALGDSMCRTLEFCGWDVTREFYINDAGNQMNTFARSIEKRYRQIVELVEGGKTVDEALETLEADRVAALDDADGTLDTHPLTDDFAGELGGDAYGGSYIWDIARVFYDQDGTAPLDMPVEERLHDFRERGYQAMLANIKDVLARCGCDFDVWFSERTLHTPDEQGKTAVTRAFDKLRAADKLYEAEGALWFRTTDYGDDKDRVLMKSDGSHTYFASDIAYHSNKFDRGFDRLIDIWGADHHGYIPRMQAAVEAMGHKGQLDVPLGQLVNLLRAGKPVRMSKRKGTMITFEELLEMVGRDATRFTLLSRSSDQEVDFDIDVVTRQSSDNPVFYVQYAHARICSILRKAAEQAGIADTSDLDATAHALIGDDPNLALLTDPAELALARHLAHFGETVAGCAKDLAPFRLTHYATGTAAAFHGFYTNCHVLTDDAELTRARLAACDAARRVLAQTLSLIGVSAPVSMEQRGEEAAQ